MTDLARGLWPDAHQRRVMLIRYARRLLDDELRLAIATEKAEVAHAREALEAAEDDLRVLTQEAAMRQVHKRGEEHGDG